MGKSIEEDCHTLIPLCLPLCDPGSSGHTSPLSFHPYYYFRPPTNAFLIFSLSVVRLFSASLTCKTDTVKTGGRNMQCLPHILPRRPLCWRRNTSKMCLHECHVRINVFASVQACISANVSVGRWTSLASRPCVQWSLMQLAFIRPSPQRLLSPVISDSCRSNKSSISIAQSVKMGQNCGATQH